MADLRVEKLAKVIVDYSLAVQPGDLFEITGTWLAAPLIEAVYESALRRGAQPYVNATLPGLEELFLAQADKEQLRHVSLIEQLVVRQFDARIDLMSEENTKALSQVDPARQVERNRAYKDLWQERRGRQEQGGLRECYALFPTQGYAQDAEMSLRVFEDLVYRACLVEEADPVAAWHEVSRRQQEIVDYLNTKETLRIVAPETEVTLSVAGRRFINCSGTVNLPDGEVFTSPVEDAVDGHIAFTYPVVTRGREVDGARLWFKGGRVVKASAEKNEAFLHQMLDTDEGARRLGEFAIGTNPYMIHFTRNAHLDEKIAGTIHLALGNAFPKAGGVNQSAIHWDMVCDLRQGEIYADGQLFYRAGEFLGGLSWPFRPE
jgi:aminopeptidase